MRKRLNEKTNITPPLYRGACDGCDSRHRTAIHDNCRADSAEESANDYLWKLQGGFSGGNHQRLSAATVGHNQRRKALMAIYNNRRVQSAEENTTSICAEGRPHL